MKTGVQSGPIVPDDSQGSLIQSILCLCGNAAIKKHHLRAGLNEFFEGGHTIESITVVKTISLEKLAILKHAQTLQFRQRQKAKIFLNLLVILNKDRIFSR